MTIDPIKNIDFEQFRIFLQSEFDKRRAKNSSYSLRAFASQLDVHAACLSVILKGKRPLTQKMIERFIKNLAISDKEFEQFSINEDDKNLNKSKTLTLDTFAILSQWYHDAILDLMKLDSFVPDKNWIAEALEISVTEVHSAVERLERCQFIKITQDGWKLLEPMTDLYINDFTTSALKNLQKKILEISTKKIETCPVERRYHSALTVAVSMKDISKAKEMIRQFRTKFQKEIEKPKKLDDVYELQIGFFPLTNLNNDITTGDNL